MGARRTQRSRGNGRTSVARAPMATHRHRSVRNRRDARALHCIRDVARDHPMAADALRHSPLHLHGCGNVDIRHAAASRHRQRDGLRVVQVPSELDGVVPAHTGRGDGNAVVLIADVVRGHRDRRVRIRGTTRRCVGNRALLYRSDAHPLLRDCAVVCRRRHAVHQRVRRRHGAKAAADGCAHDPVGATTDRKIVPRAVRIGRASRTVGRSRTTHTRRVQLSARADAMHRCIEAERPDDRRRFTAFRHADERRHAGDVGVGATTRRISNTTTAPATALASASSA